MTCMQKKDTEMCLKQAATLHSIEGRFEDGHPNGDDNANVRPIHQHQSQYRLSDDFCLRQRRYLCWRSCHSSEFDPGSPGRNSKPGIAPHQIPVRTVTPQKFQASLQQAPYCALPELFLCRNAMARRRMQALQTGHNNGTRDINFTNFHW